MLFGKYLIRIKEAIITFCFFVLRLRATISEVYLITTPFSKSVKMELHDDLKELNIVQKK